MLSKNQIKELQSLHLKKFRDVKKLFIAEGAKLVTELLNTRPGIIKEMFATRNFFERHRSNPDLADVLIEITEAELKKISLLSTPNEVLCVCRYVENSQPAKPGAGLSLYLDDIRDPGNFGTIIRLADWYGIRDIYCSPSGCDLYNPKVIQSTMGAFLRVNVFYKTLDSISTAWQKPVIYGALLKGRNIYGEDLKNGLIVIGNEAKGISPENLKYITHPVTIPASHHSGTESLNAALATAIIVSEFHRQLQYEKKA